MKFMYSVTPKSFGDFFPGFPVFLWRAVMFRLITLSSASLVLSYIWYLTRKWRDIKIYMCKSSYEMPVFCPILSKVEYFRQILLNSSV